MTSGDSGSSSPQQLLEFLSKYTQQSKENEFSFSNLFYEQRVQEIAQASLNPNNQVRHQTINK